MTATDGGAEGRGRHSDQRQRGRRGRRSDRRRRGRSTAGAPSSGISPLRPRPFILSLRSGEPRGGSAPPAHRPLVWGAPPPFLSAAAVPAAAVWCAHPRRPLAAAARPAARHRAAAAAPEGAGGGFDADAAAARVRAAAGGSSGPRCQGAAGAARGHVRSSRGAGVAAAGWCRPPSRAAAASRPPAVRRRRPGAAAEDARRARAVCACARRSAGSPLLRAADWAAGQRSLRKRTRAGHLLARGVARRPRARAPAPRAAPAGAGVPLSRGAAARTPALTAISLHSFSLPSTHSLSAAAKYSTVRWSRRPSSTETITLQSWAVRNFLGHKFLRKFQLY